MKGFENILYVAEESVNQTSAVARAVSLAETHHAELTIIDVIPSTLSEYQTEVMASRMTTLEALAAPFQHRLHIHLKVAMGTVFLEVIRAVLRDSYDLVMKIAEDPDSLKRLFGSIDMHLLRKCPCPVWLTKPGEKDKYKRILAAVDFDPLKSMTTEQQDLNQRILELSSSLALADSASLHLIHAWQVFAEGTMRARGDGTDNDIGSYIEKEYMGHQKGLAGFGETLKQSIGDDAYDRLNPRFHLPRGLAQNVIPQAASELHADLVVMGTVARTGISGFFIGNTAEAILDQLTCSVLAVKPPGFVSPVKIAD
jgi:universal stress protein E